MSVGLESKMEFKEIIKEALINAGEILMSQAKNLSEDIEHNNVSEIYITIHIESDGSPHMDVTKTYMPL